jgi:catechol 2,3-dioxygenase-like lactoylglutathione lyase family enzyme
MIDHVYVSVTHIEKSLAFYAEALKPLGWSLSGNYDAAGGPENVPDLYGLADNVYVSGAGPGSSIWLRQRKPGETGLYLMLRTPPPSKQVAPTKVSPPTGPTSRPATTPPTSPTLTATAWSSCTRLGTRARADPLGPAHPHLTPGQESRTPDGTSSCEDNDLDRVGDRSGRNP